MAILITEYLIVYNVHINVQHVYNLVRIVLLVKEVTEKLHQNACNFI